MAKFMDTYALSDIGIPTGLCRIHLTGKIPNRTVVIIIVGNDEGNTIVCFGVIICRLDDILQRNTIGYVCTFAVPLYTHRAKNAKAKGWSEIV